MKRLQLATLLCTTTTAFTFSYDATLDFHLAKQFDSKIDSGGKIGATRYGAELRLDYTMTNDDALQLRFQYQRDDWDFSGTSGMGGDNPWDIVTTIDLALQWTHQIYDKTQLFSLTEVRNLLNINLKYTIHKPMFPSKKINLI